MDLQTHTFLCVIRLTAPLYYKSQMCSSHDSKHASSIPPVESRLLLESTRGANSSLVRKCKGIESRISPLSNAWHAALRRCATSSSRRCHLLALLSGSGPGADSLLKSPGWRKVWKDEPRILLTGDGFFSPSAPLSPDPPPLRAGSRGG